MSLRDCRPHSREVGRPILPSGIIKIEKGTRQVDDLAALALTLGVAPNRLMSGQSTTASRQAHAAGGDNRKRRLAVGVRHTSSGRAMGLRVPPATSWLSWRKTAARGHCRRSGRVAHQAPGRAAASRAPPERRSPQASVGVLHAHAGIRSAMSPESTDGQG